MTKRTLTDELRSVLLAHSLDAPEPDETVDRVLTGTVGGGADAGADLAPAGSGDPTARRWRVPGRLLVAAGSAAVLVLAIAGIDAARRQSVTGRQNATGSATGAVRTGQPQSTAAGGPQLAPRVPGAPLGTAQVAPCVRADLTATVTVVTPVTSSGPVQAGPAWLLSLTNRTSAPCALEGYPVVRPRRAGQPLGAAAVPTLRGAAGGVTNAVVPPIVVLKPGATAAALLERGLPAGGAGCQQSDQLAVTLPNGSSLGLVEASVPACGLVVHPLVGNPHGSD